LADFRSFIETETNEQIFSFNKEKLKSITRKNVYRKAAFLANDKGIRVGLSYIRGNDERDISAANNQVLQVVNFNPMEIKKFNSENFLIDNYKNKLISEVMQANEMIREIKTNYYHNVEIKFSRVMKRYFDSNEVNKILSYDKISLKAAFISRNNIEDVDLWVCSSAILQPIDISGFVKKITDVEIDKIKKKVELKHNFEYKFVICRPDIILNKISLLFRSDFVLENNLDMLMERENLFNEKISFYDCKYDLKSGICELFDDEGMETTEESTILLKGGGIIKNINNLMYANMKNESCTANAVLSKSGKISIGFKSFRVSRGETSFDDLFKTSDSYVIINLISDVVLQPNWEVLIKVTSAYTISGGKVVNKLKPFLLRSNVFKILGSGFVESLSEGINENSINPMIILNLAY